MAADPTKGTEPSFVYKFLGVFPKHRDDSTSSEIHPGLVGMTKTWVIWSYFLPSLHSRCHLRRHMNWLVLPPLRIRRAVWTKSGAIRKFSLLDTAAHLYKSGTFFYLHLSVVLWD